MEWFSDLVWLVGEWFLLLALSALVGLLIGWFVWRRQPVAAGPVVHQPATATGVASTANVASEQEVIDLTSLTSERDALRFQRDRLRFQLREIEALVGNEEVRQGRDGRE